MRISRLELKNVRVFSHLLLENIPDVVVLVSPNGLGKSTVLEIIAATHDIVGSYRSAGYPYKKNLVVDGQSLRPSAQVWPPKLPAPVRRGSDKAEVGVEIEANRVEEAYLKGKGISERTGKASFVIEHERFITSQEVDPVASELFRYHAPRTGVGFIDYLPPVRIHLRRSVGGPGSITDETTKEIFPDFGADAHGNAKFSQTKVNLRRTPS